MWTCGPPEHASPTAASPGTDLGVPVTLTVLTGDGSFEVGGQEWPGDMQCTQARSGASRQAGVDVRTA